MYQGTVVGKDECGTSRNILSREITIYYATQTRSMEAGSRRQGGREEEATLGME